MKVEKVGNVPDVVTGIHWICKATDPDHLGLEGGESGFMYAPPPDPNIFISVNDLTSEIVNTWIADNLNKSEVENRCLKYLQDQIVPPVQLIDVPIGTNTVDE
jgi:hypothetical protein